MKQLLLSLAVLPFFMSCGESAPIKARVAATPKTFCNPVNIDYRFMKIDGGEGIREAADPVVVSYKDKYYLFASKSSGYWCSDDFTDWKHVFITDSVLPIEDYAPGLFVHDNFLYYVGSTHGKGMLYRSSAPEKGEWEPVKEIWSYWDPAFYVEGDNLYMYYGCSPVDPIYMQVLDLNTLEAKTEVVACFNSDKENHGWERTGELNELSRRPYIEGAWMTAHQGKYYLQYAAPGTQFNVYGDGVYVGKSPLGPFEYAAHNPFCYKPGGFATGAGHGSTVCGPGGIYWHFGTIHLSINYKFERRLCMFPTFFDEDGAMYSDTYFGDYPHYSPDQVSRQTTSGGFRGWMLLSYGKPVKASSQLESYPVENVTDENLKTFWVAEKNDDKQWVEIDLEEVSDVYALQLNFFDYEETGFWGRMPNLRQRYLVEASVDGARWRVLVDYRNSFRDAPHNYIELDQPIEARYIRYRHHYVPGKNLAMGDIRVFGLGRGKKPATVKGFTVVREADERNARISWKAVKGAQGYNVLWGVALDKLYSSWMVYGDNSLDLRALTVGQKYYFAIESFNENGISQRVFLREAH